MLPIREGEEEYLRFLQSAMLGLTNGNFFFSLSCVLRNVKAVIKHLNEPNLSTRHYFCLITYFDYEIIRQTPTMRKVICMYLNKSQT